MVELINHDSVAGVKKKEDEQGTKHSSQGKGVMT